MKMIVDGVQRKAKMRAHTATHLLHFSLDTILGGTKQAGSLVDNDFLRFDFAAKKPLTQEQLSTIETEINNRIAGGFEVSVQELSLPEAKELGAKAFFEDKYGDIVRVVSVHGVSNQELHSVELCGGTHVSSTDQIGAFTITGQEAVASGIRRISAVTGTGVSKHGMGLQNQLENIASQLDCQPKQLTEKVEKLLKELTQSRNEYASLQSTLLTASLSTVEESSHELFDYILNISDSTLSGFDFKAIVQQAKSTRSDKNRVLYTPEGTFAIHCEGDQSAKEFAQQNSLKGGGSDQLVQGRDTSIQELFAN